ncbi:MAG: GNAT family N-acetyltransferase [Angustibacter sp.]
MSGSDVPVRFRGATAEDLPAVLALLRDDTIAASRDAASGGESPDAYRQAFAAIETNPHDQLVVGDRDGRVVACAQVTLLHHLSRRGATRAHVESVRVADDERGRGVGTDLLRWVEAWAFERGAALIQLTTDKRRLDAHRFYERLGYTASHEGMKRPLP